MKRVYNNRKRSQIFQEAKINLQSFGQSLSISGAPPVRDPEEALIRAMLAEGVSEEFLTKLGLEYKYLTWYLTGKMGYE